MMMAGPIIVEIEPWWSKYFRKIRGLGFTGPLRGVRLKKLRVWLMCVNFYTSVESERIHTGLGPRPPILCHVLFVLQCAG